MVNPTATESITAIKEAIKLSNDVRSKRFNNETKRIRRKLYKKEAASRFFKEKELYGTLTNRQKNVVKNINTYLKNFGKHLNKSQKH